MTLEEGRIRTWRLPAFSALLMALSASLRTEVLTILTAGGDSQFVERKGGICESRMLASRASSIEECPHDEQRVLQLVGDEE